MDFDHTYGLPWLTHVIDDRCFQYKEAPDESFDDILDAIREYSDDEKIAISLSGGLDSMVLLHAFKKNTNAEIVAFHLDYGNRVESADEARFLKRYCEKNDVELFTEQITGLTRFNTRRSTYEKETRKIRFQNYRSLLQQHTECNGIHLAHHKDDIAENIFTNVLKNSHHLDLSVLKPSNIIDGVKIVRPFLGIRKERLYMYADNFKVPYFKDTTPEWSCRGKMRNEIFPKLKDCFGHQFTQNLLNFDKQLSSSNNLLSEFMKYFKEYIKIGNIVTLNVALGHTQNMPIYFWTLIFNNFCEKMKIKHFSRKSINYFFENKDLLQTIIMSSDCKLHIPGIYGFIEIQLT